MKTLIIAEKPSVATDIARVIGGMKKTGDFYEGEEYVVSNALGHLLELVCPEKYEPKRGKWTFDHLPVLPPSFDLKPITRSAEKLKSLKKLIGRKDIGCLINACDAGREGELIFRYIVEATKAKQPIKRLWLQSMTPSAIREAFAHLRTDEQMQSLAQAAKSRSEADWLVGINGTRAMTAFNNLDGGFFLTTVGRVQTPTLAIVVRRENEIRAFKPKDYWEVHARFSCAGGAYTGRWFDENFKKGQDTGAKPERIFDEKKATDIVSLVQAKTGTVTESSKRTTMLSPQLFDLTSLQREANNKFGFSAKTTLSIAQALYEKHKVLTYPRTDSRALPEDYLSTVQSTLKMLGESSNRYTAFADEILKNKWVRPNKRIFDNSKISDHFAIIPTLQAPKSALSEAEGKVYDLVVRRFMAVFYPAAEFDVTTRITRVQEQAFKTEGKILVSPGWMAVYGKEEGSGSDALTPLGGDAHAVVEQVQKQAFKTKPPARYTEATLLSAMEGAGKLVDDEELRDAMAQKGLGTPATRAAIIENLIDQNYMRRMGRDLQPTAKAQELFTLLDGLGISALSDPALTGEWEYKLSQIEKNQLSREAFMREIRQLTTQIVEAAKHYEADTVVLPNPVHLKARCPKCGGEIVENYRRYACTADGCDFSLPKHPAGRTFEVAEVEELVSKGIIGPLDGFISKQGRPFSAGLRINGENRLEFVFPDSQQDAETESTEDMAVIGKCPKCGSDLLQGAAAYCCAHAIGSGRTCDFRVGRVILQQPISEAEVQKIVTEGKSSLLTDFVSNKSHRKFKAYLVMDKKTKKIGFEFPPREAAPKKTATRKKTGA